MFLAAFILLIITVVLMVKPLTSALLTAAFFAYIFHPMYEWLRLRIKSGSIAAILIILLIIAIFVVPVTLAFNTLTGEIFSGYLIIKQKLATAEMGNFALFEAQPQLGEMFGNTLNKITAGIVDYTSTFIFKISNKLIDFFITFFITYYLLKDGKKMLLWIKERLPIKKEHQSIVFSKFNNSIYGVVYGTVINAFIQGAAASIGLYILGVPSPLFWGLLTAVLTIIPAVGAAGVWLPISAFYFISGLLNSDNSMIGKGAILFVYGTLVISSIDNILKPKIIGTKAKIHPAFVLLGVVGGVKVFGVIGIIAGPVIFALLTTFIEIYTKRK